MFIFIKFGKVPYLGRSLGTSRVPSADREIISGQQLWQRLHCLGWLAPSPLYQVGVGPAES
jgi:hypothetical protein